MADRPLPATKAHGVADNFTHYNTRVCAQSATPAVLLALPVPVWATKTQVEQLKQPQQAPDSTSNEIKPESSNTDWCWTVYVQQQQQHQRTRSKHQHQLKPATSATQRTHCPSGNLHSHMVLSLLVLLLCSIPSLHWCCCCCLLPHHKVPGVDCDCFGGVVSLIDAHQAIRQLKHVVAQADDDKLGVLGALLDIVAHCRTAQQGPALRSTGFDSDAWN
jgi:hypothetical protein